MQKISTCLWFDTQAEEAAHFYTSIFKDSRVVSVDRYGEAGPGEPGTVLMVVFELAGREFMALNGGPAFQFTEASSMFVKCENQAEVDEYWDRLTEGGEESQCGWLKDKYGLSWQIVPNRLGELLGDENRDKANAVMQAMLKMRKIEVPELERAYESA